MPPKRSVGLVAMQYFGPSVEDAVSKFASQLAGAFPEGRCDGWNWAATIDPDRLRRSIDR